MIIYGRTLVSLRTIFEALGAEISWNTAIQTVTIDTVTQQLTVNVVKVVDGDTIKVTIDGKEENVRLIGVDTPETVHPSKPVQPYDPEASAYTKSRLEGQTVRLEFDVQERDQYGRLLAYVWLNDEMINKTLVAEGYAMVATFPPNIRYVDDFTKLQTQARDAKKGLWRLE